jgi:hypothetical protein
MMQLWIQRIISGTKTKYKKPALVRFVKLLVKTGSHYIHQYVSLIQNLQP